MFNIIRLRMLSEWQENIWMRDAVSILLFIFISSFCNIFTDLFTILMDGLLSIFNHALVIFYSTSTIDNTKLINTLLNISNELIANAINMILFTFCVLVLATIIQIIKKSKISLLISVISLIVFNCFQSPINVSVVVITIVFLIPLTWIIPVGSGKYFGIIEFLSYFRNMYPLKVNIGNLNWKTILKFLLKIVLRILLPMFFYLFFLSEIFIEIDTILAIQIYFCILLFAFLNYSENLVNLSMRRIAIYMLIVILTISNVNTAEIELIPTIISIFTILFSLNRVSSVFNDIKEDVESNSCLYVIEHRGNDADWLVDNYIDYRVMEKVRISENIFLRQIIIHHLTGSAELLDMMVKYKELYETNIKLVNQLEFMELFNQDTIDKKWLIKNYESCFTKKDESYSYIPAYGKYCSLLIGEEQYSKCIEILGDSFFVLDTYSKYQLYYANFQLGYEKEALIIKENIEGFEDIEEEFRDNN